MLYLFLAFLNGIICWRKQLTKNVSNKFSLLVFKFLFLEILTEGIGDNILQLLFEFVALKNLTVENSTE